MTYNPDAVRDAYNRRAEVEDQAEKEPSLRTELPREFIKKYLRLSDVVLDAGGGAGINATMMAQRCQKVTLLDISPRILELAARNIEEAGLREKIELVEGDITDLGQFEDGQFSFVACVGDSISYALDQAPKAIDELVRVAGPEATLVLGCDSKFGFVRLYLKQGLLDEAIRIYGTSHAYCGMGPKTRLYTVDEMRGLLESAGCHVLEVASTPTFTDTFDKGIYAEPEQWEKLKALELQVCTRPELLGMGEHLLFIARKL